MKKLIICTLGLIGIASMVFQKEMKLPLEDVSLPLWRDVENHQAISTLEKVKVAPEKKSRTSETLRKTMSHWKCLSSRRNSSLWISRAGNMS